MELVDNGWRHIKTCRRKKSRTIHSIRALDGRQGSYETGSTRSIKIRRTHSGGPASLGQLELIQASDWDGVNSPATQLNRYQEQNQENGDEHFGWVVPSKNERRFRTTEDLWTSSLKT